MYRSILVFVHFLVLVIGVQAQNGIHFEKVSWNEVLQKAAEENKLVFVDAFTTWCGPCKRMTKEVFSQAEVASFYNQSFVNYKIDMEKGEGPRLAKQYKVAQYPTLLFIDAAGNLVHRAAGYHDRERLLSLGNEALTPSEQLATQEKRFAAGDRDPEFLRSYIELRAKSYDGSHLPIAEAYLESVGNVNNEDIRAFVFGYLADIDSKLFDHYANFRKDYLQQFGVRNVDTKINTIVADHITKNSTDDTLMDLASIERLFQKAYPADANERLSAYKMTYYRTQGDRNGYAKAALKHYKKYPTEDAGELNEVAWTIFSVVEKKKYLKGALKLAKKSAALESAYYNHDTMAALLHKLGKNKAALKTANKAIELAKAENFDPESYAETLKLIQQIEAGN